jgi:hypothetical protein
MYKSGMVCRSILMYKSGTISHSRLFLYKSGTICCSLLMYKSGTVFLSPLHVQICHGFLFPPANMTRFVIPSYEAIFRMLSNIFQNIFLPIHPFPPPVYCAHCLR